MKLYRVTVSLDIEAQDEDEAARTAEKECSSAFNSVEAIRLLDDYSEQST